MQAQNEASLTADTSPNPVLMKVVSSYHKTKSQIDEEAQQVEAAKANPESFGVLYEKYHEQIFRYAYQRTGDKEVSFDVTSQIFLKAMTNLHKYESRGLPFGAWLFRIAKSEVYQLFRNNKANRTINVETSQLADLLEEFEEDGSDEKRQLLVEVLREIPEEDVQLIEMRFFEKRPFKEIAEINDITENYAKVKVYRIIEKMKKIVSKK